MNINELNEKELNDLELQIEKRKEQLIHEKNVPRIEKTKEIVELILANKSLLELFPHTRSSCRNSSDQMETYNGFYEHDKDVYYADCNRCWLNQIIEEYEDIDIENIDFKNIRFVINGLSFDMQKL